MGQGADGVGRGPMELGTCPACEVALVGSRPVFESRIVTGVASLARQLRAMRDKLSRGRVQEVEADLLRLSASLLGETDPQPTSCPPRDSGP